MSTGRVKSPAQRSLRLLRERGYLAEVVEKWITITAKKGSESDPKKGFGVRKDLWGWCDIIALKDNEVLAVQCTSASNVSSRVKKITDSPNLSAVRKAGIVVHVHGWRIGKNGRWQVREVDLS